MGETAATRGAGGRRGEGRRRFLKLVGAAGAAGATFGRALVVLAEDAPQVTDVMVRQAGRIAGLELSDDERAMMLEGVNELVADFGTLRQLEIDNAVPPALVFRTPLTPPPRADRAATAGPGASDWRPAAGRRPDDEDDVAFATVAQLAGWLRSGAVTSTELTRLYLDRLRRLDPTLEFVTHLTEERALRQADRADRELAAGRWRGPLHGVPWGAKDLLAVPGYPTTWGATPFREQVRDELATVVARLDDAGAVLVAKLTLGALAWGDVWYGGTTKNPWNPEQGSSGSSAGSASAAAAGAVGFAIGSETWGSIVSPCTRCGATGLRPTFGRVSRHGAMALAWSMDKLGPIARSVEDCALVFAAIQGPDGLDPSVADRPFRWPFPRDPRTLRVGWIPELFEEDRAADADDEDARRDVRQAQEHDRRTLAVLRGMGLRLEPFRLPDDVPVSALSFILSAEAATAFDALTRSGRDDELVRQIARAWPNVFRQAQLIPAVEYLRANRARTMLMQAMERQLGDLDLYVCPSFGGDNLLLTNLTGHPAVVLPNGFTDDGAPTSITFNGRLHREGELLAVAGAYQQATDFHLRRPPVATS